MKFKKFLTPLIAAAITASAMPVSSVSAVGSRVYIDISCDSKGETRAYVTFENMPNVFAAGFHIELGDGWKLKPNNYGDYTGTAENYVSSTGASIQGDKSGENEYFIQITSNRFDSKLDKHTYSFLIEKTENFNSNNSAINVVFKQSDLILNMENGKYNYIITPENDTSPPMLRAEEYIIGDANNDGRVNAIDASWIRIATDKIPQYGVNDIKESYKDIFPEANCAAAPDADLNGIIEVDDAQAISQYYADMSTIGYSNTRIGQREFYEILDN